MPKHKKRQKKLKKPLDKVVVRRRRGRRPRIPASEIRGRANNFRLILGQVWERLWPLLSKATTEQAVINAFSEGADLYAREFVPEMSHLILEVLHERRFPKHKEPQINFLADSLAGLGIVTARSSRDICERDRAREKRAHHIIRYEVYVECSCGFKGRSWNHACRKCGAEIDFGFAPFIGALV